MEEGGALQAGEVSDDGRSLRAREGKLETSGPEVRGSSLQKGSRGSLHATCDPWRDPGDPIAKLGPLAEPNEAMATQAQMEKWFTLEKVRSEELPSGDGCDP